MGFSLCEQGKVFMHKQKEENRWNKYDQQWYSKANVSESTLKRFWGLPPGVDKYTFIHICEVAGVSNASEMFEWLTGGCQEDSTCINPEDLIDVDMKSMTDMSLQESSLNAKLTENISSCSLNSNLAILVRHQSYLTQTEQDLVNHILDDLKVNYLSSPSNARLLASEQHSSLSESAKYKCAVIISGCIAQDNKFIVDCILNDLDCYVKFDSQAIQWKSINKTEN